MKKKNKKATPKVYAKALSEIAQDIANARAYREMPKRTAEDFLNEKVSDLRNEIKK